jgi:hypothetical protein
MTGNEYGGGLENAGTEATFQRCEVSGSVTGGAGGLAAIDMAVLRVSDSTLTRNVFGLQQGSGAIVESFGNNVVRGNATNTTGTITSVTLQ